MLLPSIACVGAGTIGHSWALLFAWKGAEVALYDINEHVLKRALEKISNSLRTLVYYGIVKHDEVSNIISRIKVTTDLKAAVKEAEYIQESASEALEIKVELFKKMEDFARRDAVIASSTSSIPMSYIQPHLKIPERTIVVHPINPPHLIPLVEVVPGIKTSMDTIKRTVDILRGFGKVPIVLRKEVKGFILNRLSAALFHEAIWLLINGVASVEDIDKAISEGLGLRWALMGQFKIWHLGGGDEGIRGFLDKLGRMVDEVYGDLDKTSPFLLLPSVKEKVIKDVETTYPNIKEEVRKRDEMLLKLLKIKGYI